MSANRQPPMVGDLPDEVRERIYAHVFDHLDVEVGGVLVGAVDDERVEVHGVIPALEAEGSRASVTFTHGAWREIIEVQERDYPDSPTIVGWYHSHPGFGVFLSEHDLFIHQNFFRESYQVAHVVDPRRAMEGMFGWRNERVQVLEEPTRVPGRAPMPRTSIVVDVDDDADVVPAYGPDVAENGEAPRVVVEDDDLAQRRRRRGLIPLLVGAVAIACVGAGLVAANSSSPPQTAKRPSQGPAAPRSGPSTAMLIKANRSLSDIRRAEIRSANRKWVERNRHKNRPAPPPAPGGNPVSRPPPPPPPEYVVTPPQPQPPPPPPQPLQPPPPPPSTGCITAACQK